MYTFAEKNFPGAAEGWIIEWSHQPIRGGAYIQDKLEFEGFIANLGLRMDYNNPNCEWPTVERYAQVLTSGLKDTLKSDNPPSEIMEPAEYQMQWSPRIGISHPITENAKLYFNYGHFYSMAPSNEMYLMHFGGNTEGMAALGNPSASMPKTIAYELGTDFNIGEMFRLHLAGYYKDVDRQTAWVRYQAEDAAVLDYSTVENNNYEDIRGLELRFEKSYGRFVKGWINYDYMIGTSGTVGREIYYQNSQDNQTEGMLDPKQETPLPQPRMNAFIQFSSPNEWGPIFKGFNLSFLYEWHAGWWETLNPLEIDDPRFENNLQWQPWRNINTRVSKTITYAGINMNVFMEVQNLLDWKYLDNNGFGPGVTESDKDEYLESLKLDIYNDPAFEGMDDYEPGNDKVGDLKSEDKPYINDPNITFLAFHNPRTLVFGLKMDF
jgi:outer membrane receptor protein involved in Fe transport